MEKAQEILFHMDELYTENPSEEKIIRQCEENPVRYQAWVDAFKDYDLSDVLQAIDNYWEFKNSKTKPNVAQIKAILEQHKIEKSVQSTIGTNKQVDDCDGFSLMAADIAAGSCRHNFPVYKAAVDLICNEWLSEEIPTSEWIKMDKSERYKQAILKGLFNRFNEALLTICRQITGRDYEFLSENEEKAKSGGAQRSSQNSIPQNSSDVANVLAAHWKIGG